MKVDVKTLVLSVFLTLAVLSLFSVVDSKVSKSSPLPAYEMHKMESGEIMIFNKYSGEVEYKEIEGGFEADYQDVYIKSWPNYGSLNVNID